MTRLAIVVADGGREAGLGHVTRSSAIAVALGRLGISVRCFALGADKPLERDGVPWWPVAAFQEVAFAEASVIVIDSYRVGSDEVGAAPLAASVVVLQDHRPPPVRTALIVSAGADADANPDSRRLAGFEYASLRPAFWTVPERAVADRIRQVLVATGGGDVVPGLGATLATAVRASLPEAEVRLVRGPFGTGDAPPGVTLLDAPESLYGPLLEADLVVTAGGQTLLEAAAAGTPSIAVVAVENQRLQAARLAALGATRLLELPADELPALLRQLDASPEERRALARNAQAAVDGRGAERVAERIAALI